ncbi:MAG: redox-sensing transcriptional repressor Rex, partial [Pyrinomonadaceae bacterium]
MKVEKISELTTNRLSIYLRCLNELSAAGVKTISSEELAKRFHLNSAQIRKDLAYFGEFGVRGVGYYVEDLKNHITKILGLDKEHRVCIIGAGRLGTALADYNGFKKSRFSVVALFDIDQSKIGQRVGNACIYDFKDFQKIVKMEKIDIAVIAVPAFVAQDVLDEIVKAGIKANFTTDNGVSNSIAITGANEEVSEEATRYLTIDPITSSTDPKL